MTSTQRPEGITLCSWPLSDCSTRLRIALNLKSLRYNIVTILLSDSERTPAHVNPSQTVPALIFHSAPDREGELTITQSLAAIEYLEEAYPDTFQLLPEDARSRARVRTLVNVVERGHPPSHHTPSELNNRLHVPMRGDRERGTDRKHHPRLGTPLDPAWPSRIRRHEGFLSKIFGTGSISVVLAPGWSFHSQSTRLQLSWPFIEMALAAYSVLEDVVMSIVDWKVWKSIGDTCTDGASGNNEVMPG